LIPLGLVWVANVPHIGLLIFFFLLPIDKHVPHYRSILGRELALGNWLRNKYDSPLFARLYLVEIECFYAEHI
jgi:hypothetical protein